MYLQGYWYGLRQHTSEIKGYGQLYNHNGC